METKPHDPQFLRTRKMATFLPIVGLPFMAVMFFLGGGGTGGGNEAQAMQSGFNTSLPKAEKANITTSKLEAYSNPIDSLRNRGLVSAQIDTAKASGLSYAVSADGKPGAVGSADKSVAEAQAQLIAAQQAQLNGGANASTTAQPGAQPGALTPQEQMELMRTEHERELVAARADAQMAALMAQSNAVGGGGGAPAVAAAPKAKKKPATRLRAVDEDAVVSRLGRNGTGRKRTASFQGFSEGGDSGGDANTVPAVIHESQEVVSGSLVKMRLTEPAVINGHSLPANTFIYGKCRLQGERLSIAIETLKAGSNVFPAALEVYDVDGLEGLHIPGAITRDAAKQAGAESMGAADMLAMSPNAGAAAAGVAVGAVKGLGQAKIRLVKVRLKAGYNIMLKVDKE